MAQEQRYQEFLDKLVREVTKELESRGLSLRFEDRITENILKSVSDFTQVTLMKEFSTVQVLEMNLKNWAIEFGCKLARPYPATFSRLEIPKGVYSGIESCNGKMWLRGIIDYDINSDALIWRFDALVKWDEPK